MACERNRIIKLENYLSSLGIFINIGKNKARGHKGIFMRHFDNYRIDISKDLSDKDILSVLLHEFAHYVHYSNDKNLKSLDFAFDQLTDDIKEELIQITVAEIPKDFARNLYTKKEKLQSELKILIAQIKQYYPDFKLTDKNSNIEKFLTLPIKYLLKYDRVKYLDKIYSIEQLENDFTIKDQEKLYIKIKSTQRNIKRINSKINRLNKYYNNPSELFARFIDSYFTRPELTKKIAPKCCKLISEKNIKLLNPITKIFSPL